MIKMQKRLWSLLLAACLVATMMPTMAFAADVTVSTEAELKSAIESASNGDTITLGADIAMLPIDCGQDVLNPHITISKDLTLNLAGHKIGWDLKGIGSKSYTDTPLIFSINGADVTITGKGTIDSEAKNNNSYGIDVINNGNLTIENGTFTGALTAVQVTKGTLTILDGTFIQAETCAAAVSQYAKYVINCIDSSFKNGTARIYLKGGTYCYDFSNNPEGAGTSYVPVDYTSTKDSNDKTWSVTAKDALTVEKPESVDSGTVDATVSGVATNISDDDVNVEGNTLFIDAKVESASNVTTSNITVGGTAISTISESTDVSDVKIKTNVGTLTVSEEALDTIVDNATTAGTTADVTLSITVKDDTEKGGSLVYTLTATDAAGNEVFADDVSSGEITVTVPYNSSTSKPAVYYLPENGSPVKVDDEKVTLDGTQLSWTVSHFSDWLITNPNAVAVYNNTAYDTLTEAITAANSGSGGTIDLLKDITSENVGNAMTSADIIKVPADKSITIMGNGKTITLTPQTDDGRAQVFSIPEDSTLTLDNVKVNITGLSTAAANGYGDGFDVWGTLNIENGSEVTVSGVTSAFTMQGGYDAEVNITNSTVNATEIKGNFSNGGTWVISGSTVDIDGCVNNALSVNKLTVKESSEVKVNDVATGASLLQTPRRPTAS